MRALLLTLALAISVGAQCTSTVTGPTTENFDAATVGTPGTYPANWIDGGGARTWNVHSGTTSSATTGPSGDHTTPAGTGNYVYVETSGSVAGDTAILEAPCTNIAALANPAIIFCYHMYFNGQTGGLLELQTFDGTNWNTIWSQLGDQGNQWILGQVPVPTGTTLQYRFQFTVGGPTTFYNDCAIDDVTVADALTAEWQLNSVDLSQDFNGVQAPGPFGTSGAVSSTLVGANWQVNFSTALAGNPHDVYATASPLVSGSGGGFYSGAGQVVNVTFGLPGSFFLYGSGLTPLFAPAPAAYTLNVAVPVPVTISSQSGILNPAHPDGATLSQGCQMDMVTFTTTILQGDDALLNIPLNNPLLFAGQTFNSIDVSTNGWVKMGANATSNDLSESADDFVNGMMGLGTAAPGVAIIWEDVDMGNRPTSMVQITEDLSGQITIAYIDADYFSSTPFGNVTCTIFPNFLAGAPTRVTLDYSGYTAALPPTEGLIGVTNGTGVTGATAVDIAAVGVVTPMGTGLSPATWFQSFDGNGTLVPAVAAEAFDLAPLIITFDDLGGNGEWVMY